LVVVVVVVVVVVGEQTKMHPIISEFYVAA